MKIYWCHVEFCSTIRLLSISRKISFLEEVLRRNLFILYTLTEKCRELSKDFQPTVIAYENYE